MDSIILRDIVLRHNIRDVNLLSKLLNYLADTIGNLFSVNSIVNYLKSSKYNTNNETLGSYIQFLTESYIIHEVPRYDIKGKEKQAMIDARETYPLKRNTMIHTPKASGPLIGYRATPTPNNVATPLPPLNPAKRGYT